MKSLNKNYFYNIDLIKNKRDLAFYLFFNYTFSYACQFRKKSLFEFISFNGPRSH